MNMFLSKQNSEPYWYGAYQKLEYDSLLDTANNHCLFTPIDFEALCNSWKLEMASEITGFEMSLEIFVSGCCSKMSGLNCLPGSS